jgi:hypothetical protein
MDTTTTRENTKKSVLILGKKCLTSNRSFNSRSEVVPAMFGARQGFCAKGEELNAQMK